MTGLSLPEPMKIGTLFNSKPAKPDPVPARCPPSAADMWREVAAGFAREGRQATTLEIEEEVGRQARLMTERAPPGLF